MMSFTIKRRIQLLAFVVLGGLFSLALLHFRVSERELEQHAELVTLLEQTASLARLIHELQRERAFSSSHLATTNQNFERDLRSQYERTDQGLRELAAQAPERRDDLATQDALRRQVLERQVTASEAFALYTAQIVRLLATGERLSLAAGGHPLQPELFAFLQWVLAKEFLGQSRGTLLGARAEGGVDAAWIARLGERTGLFEWHLARHRQLSGDQQSALPTTDTPEIRAARAVLTNAIARAPERVSEEQRRNWYATMSAAIDSLHRTELATLDRLWGEARALQTEARLRLNAQRAGLLLVAAVLIYLALTSLRQILDALQLALHGVRRARHSEPPLHPPEADDEVGEIEQSIGQMLDLVERLNVRASTDPLTQALNRQGLSEAATAELERARRYGRRLSMIVFDLDHFKRINDEFGHAAGDRVLQTVARLVQENLRLADVFARWGGEEFVILAPESSEEEAMQLAEKLRAAFQTFRSPEIPIFAASFGVAAYTASDDFDRLFDRADQALYAAKTTGRDRVVGFSRQPEMPKQALGGRRRDRSLVPPATGPRGGNT